jgi:hypothetical protein
MSSFSVGQELVDKLVNQDTIHRPSARQLVQAPYFGSVTRIFIFLIDFFLSHKMLRSIG